MKMRRITIYTPMSSQMNTNISNKLKIWRVNYSLTAKRDCFKEYLDEIDFKTEYQDYFLLFVYLLLIQFFDSHWEKIRISTI